MTDVKPLTCTLAGSGVVVTCDVPDTTADDVTPDPPVNWWRRIFG